MRAVEAVPYIPHDMRFAPLPPGPALEYFSLGIIPWRPGYMAAGFGLGFHIWTTWHLSLN